MPKIKKFDRFPIWSQIRRVLEKLTFTEKKTQDVTTEQDGIRKLNTSSNTDRKGASLL